MRERRRFQSQDSRRWLPNLGFPIGTGSSEIVPNITRTPPINSNSAFDPSQLEEIETIDVRASFSWLRAGVVTLDTAGFPQFPALPKVSGLYRYDFGIDESGTRTLYIGESVELARRASNYRNAKTDHSRQRTSRRIHKEIVGHPRAAARSTLPSPLQSAGVRMRNSISASSPPVAWPRTRRSCWRSRALTRGC